MTSIADLADNSIAVELAIAARNQDKARKKAGDIAVKISDLCDQARSVAELLEQARLAVPDIFRPPGVEGVRRRMLGHLSFLPRRMCLVEQKNGREGWSVAEVSVLAKPRWWWRVASYFHVAGSHRNSKIVIGSKGIVLLTEGVLYEYFWPKSSRWIVIGNEYRGEKDSLPKFEIPKGYERIFSEFSQKGISAQRLAASLEGCMFTLAKAALPYRR